MQHIEPRIRWAAEHEPRHARIIGQGWPGDYDYDPEEEQAAGLQALEMEQERGQDDRLLTALCVALPVLAMLWFAVRAVVEAW